MSAELAKRVGDDAAREILQWRSSPERRKATPEEISHEIEFLNGTFERSMAVALTVDYWFIKGALDCAEKYPEVFGTEIGIQGCGNGIYACYLAWRFPESRIVGYETSDLLVGHARKLASNLNLTNISGSSGMTVGRFLPRSFI